MLTIPEAVKALFKTDGTWKNFRAHFPNGEYPDITNANVVRESVRFTESVCSQQVLRFGLAEASMVEFETVGVGNMYGMAIECGIEIDTASLSAAQITAIQADPGDGVLVLAADSDIGRGFYRVPLGSFRVQSCPRNQGAMTHRKVQACSLSGGTQVTNSPIELGKLRGGIYHGEMPNYAPSIPRVVYAALGWYSPELLAGFTKASAGTWTDWPDATGPAAYLLDTWNGENGVDVEIRMPYKIVSFADPDALYALDMSGWAAADVDTALDWIKTTVDGFGDDGAAARARIAGAIKARILSAVAFGSEVRFDGDLPVFYPEFVSIGTSPKVIDATLQIYLPASASISVNSLNPDYPGSDSTSIASLYTATPVLYKYADSFPAVYGDFPPTSTKDISGRDRYSYVDAYDIQALTNGWMELCGQFVRAARTGGAEIVELDSTSPVQIGPADMPEFWWDEYDVSPVGVIKYACGDGADRQEYELTVSGGGGSLYGLAENTVLAAMASASASDIETLLQTALVPELAKVTYTPVNLTMRSWPWIQAGDPLELTAEDGTVVNTYALTRTISGIQLLMDVIESKGGELTED